MDVLSLFDGMSCGQIALNKLGIEYGTYYASEIDKAAIDVTQDNFPNTIQVGDVTKLKGSDFPNVDLLIGGSPCQGFSFAGKQLNFNDPRSSLFFEYVRLLNEINPKYFLLENVKMKQEYQDVITQYLGVKPIEINSSLVSAHDRKRLYWTNIPFDINDIQNKNLILENILDVDVNDSLFINEHIANRFIENKNHKDIPTKSCVIGRLSPYQGDRVFSTKCKGSSLSASGGNNGGGSCNIIIDPYTGKLRKLSINECERLQTVPDNYTKVAPITQRYKMLGNGWTVDVIANIFSNIKVDVLHG
jgi:site-specific DNA-cytosine methylase